MPPGTEVRNGDLRTKGNGQNHLDHVPRGLVSVGYGLETGCGKWLCGRDHTSSVVEQIIRYSPGPAEGQRNDWLRREGNRWCGDEEEVQMKI